MVGLTTALFFSAGGDSSAHVPAQNKGICKVAQEFQRSGWGALWSLFWAGMHVEKRAGWAAEMGLGRKVGSLQERGISVPELSWETGPRKPFPLPGERKCDLAVVQKWATVYSGLFKAVCNCNCLKEQKNGISTHESGIKRFACLCSWKAGPEYLITTSNHYWIVKEWLLFRPKMRQFKEALTGPFLY